VRFLQDDTPFVAGQVYDLTPEQAEKMIQHGVAVEEDAR